MRKITPTAVLTTLGLTAPILWVTLAPAPLAAQTGSTWHNQKMSDMKSHQRGQDYDSRAQTYYQMALEHAADVQRLSQIDEPTPKQSKKLDKAYAKAVKHLDKALAEEPEWQDAWMLLGAIHQTMEQYGPARDAYAEAVALAPDSADAREYLETVEWYLTQESAREEPEAADAG